MLSIAASIFVLSVGVITIYSINLDKKRIKELKLNGITTVGRLKKLKRYHTGSKSNKRNKAYSYQAVYEYENSRGEKFLVTEMSYSFKGKHGDVREELSKGVVSEVTYLEYKPKISKLSKELENNFYNI